MRNLGLFDGWVSVVSWTQGDLVLRSSRSLYEDVNVWLRCTSPRCKSLRDVRLATRCSSVNMETHASDSLPSAGANIWEAFCVVARPKAMGTSFGLHLAGTPSIDMNSMDGGAVDGSDLL